MTVAELIERLQAMPGDLPVTLMFDCVGVSPLAEVKQMATAITRVLPGGIVRPDFSSGGVLECTLIAHVPQGWRKKRAA